MSRNRKSTSIADQINNILKPKELNEEKDENEAKLEDFNEHIEINNQLSDIRKQTAKHLSEIDSKYKGKVVSRKELEQQESDDLFTGSEDDEPENSIKDEEEDSEDDNMNIEEDDSDDGENNEESDNEEEVSGNDEEDSEGDDDDDDYNISQYFEQQQPSNKSSGNQDKTVLLNKSSVNEEVRKGVCVQNQLKIWEILLEVRMKAQKMLITANSLPDYDSHLELCAIEESPFSEKVEESCDEIQNLMDNLLELKTTLVEKFSESKDIFKASKRKNEDEGSSFSLMKRSKLAEYEDKIENNHESYKDFRNQVLEKWHNRTKNLKDAKNPLTNLSIATKIENALFNKNDVIRKSQIYRGDYEIYGVQNPKIADSETSKEIHLPEIYDDSDFYHHLLRELIEYKSSSGDNQAEITQKFIELQKVRSKMKKKVDTRASKGRKIRYNVHNKLVSFIAPNDNSRQQWTDEAKTELFNSLFGKVNTNATS